MNWTREDPKQEGYYWLRQSGSGEFKWSFQIVEIRKIRGFDEFVIDYMAHDQGGRLYELDKDRWWCGPFEPPDVD